MPLNEFEFNNPAPFISPSFQTQLDLIGGRMKDGRPKIRLCWGQDQEVTTFWRGKRRLKYLHHFEREMVGWKAFHATGVEILPPSPNPPQSKALVVEKMWEDKDIGIPRWFVEQILPASVACEGWDKVRYDLNPETKELEDSMGEAPKDGLYEEGFYMVADHSQCCDKGEFKSGCLGFYRAPEQHDIEYVKWLMSQLEKEAFKYHWEDIPSPQVVVQSLLERKRVEEEKGYRQAEEMQYRVRNSVLSSKGASLGTPRVVVPDLKGLFQRARKF